jgi:hypothetical protein
MQYTKGTIGRVFVLKFEDDDIVLEKLNYFLKKEGVKTATMIFLGALKKGNLVTGPKKPIIPPQPNWVSFKDGWEVMGMGSVFTNKTGPQIHIHASMGKKNKVLTGCLRKDSRVFLVVEAVVFELKGVKATKEIDPKTGINLLRIMR